MRAGLNQNNTDRDLPLSVDQIGGVLAFARRDQKMTLEQVAARLRLPKAYIKALEQSDFDSLPGVAYVPGYLRSYCKLLNIQAAPLVAAWRASLSLEDSQPAFKSPLQALTPRMAGSMAAMLLVVAGLSGYALWFVFAQPQPADIYDAGPAEIAVPSQMQGDLADRYEGGETRLAEASDTQSGQTVSGQTVSDKGVADQPVTELASANTPQPALPLAGDSPPAVKKPLADTQRPAAQLAAAEPALSSAKKPGLPADTALPHNPRPGLKENSATSAIARPVNPRDELVIRSTAAAWVEIVRSDGSVVVSRLLRDGEKLMAEIDDGLLLSTGNAGGLMLEYGDAGSFRIGKVGEILRDLPLNRQLLRNNRPQADAAN